MRSSTDPNRLYRFESGKPGPHLLITAGVHGDEYEPMIAARALIASISGILHAGRVTIIPVVNRSAYARASRMGADGLDLARICPGNPQGSVTEVEAAFVSTEIRQADYLIDMHTGGALFNIFPLAGYMLHADKNIRDQQLKMALAFGLPVVWGTDAAPDGRTLSIARDAGVPAIYVEYGGGGMFNDNIVTAYTNGCAQVMAELGMTVGETSRNQPQYLVEDDNPGSGYLQGKLPSPAAGIFIATMPIGERVMKGDLIGSVVDPLTGDRSEVRAYISGLILFLRSAIPATIGESLGGIIPVDQLSINREA